MFDLTTGGPRLRYVCDHLRHPTTGESPVIVLKPAGFDLYSGWRRPEAAREQALRRRQHALYAAAGITAQEAMRPELPMREGPATRLKVYVRDADALPEVEALMRDRLPGVPHLLLHGHVCRQELAVEIDGVHG